MNRKPIIHPNIENKRAISLPNGYWQVQMFDGSLPAKRVLKENGKERLVPQDRWYPCGIPTQLPPIWGQQ